MEIEQLIKKQRAYFETGKTKEISFRIGALKTLRQAILKYKKEIDDALLKDLGKSSFETYMCETGMVLSELSHMIRHLRGYARDRRVLTPLAQFHAKSFTSPQPYGVTLVMSPWNYPFMLSLEPLIGAIAAGNCCIVKPSAYSPNVSKVICSLIRETMIRHLRGYARDRRVLTPLAQFHAKSFTSPQPYGVTLVMSPWNYPFMLALEPAIGAIAAGNCVVIKPSAYAPATSSVIGRLMKDCFSSHFVAVVEGGRKENETLLEQRFDFIFFTGSVTVGKLVMEKAAQNLTPVCLELGGKSPCIVDRTANIKRAAQRIVFGKYLNLGQTCVAPDYLFVHAKVKERLLEEMERCIRKQFGDRPLENHDYGKIINRKHYERLCRLMRSQNVRFGGETQPETLRIAPTVLDGVRPSDPVMQEEIFGPILPVLTYRDISEVIAYVTDREKPLALYLFTGSRAVERQVLKHCSFGGGCINDTIIHLATSRMGFGGVGASGMGSYHGKCSFETFSHRRSIVKKYTWLDLPIRYQPYTSWKRALLEIFLR